MKGDRILDENEMKLSDVPIFYDDELFLLYRLKGDFDFSNLQSLYTLTS